jgi:hypothetical protein
MVLTIQVSKAGDIHMWRRFDRLLIKVIFNLNLLTIHIIFKGECIVIEGLCLEQISAFLGSTPFIII